ncbi:MAG: L-ribulose-5-phosphate 3-epimerase [Candidatus Pelagisphaera sp.]|jgi:L-ribulose-5-phosphate 3-epimerase
MNRRDFGKLAVTGALGLASGGLANRASAASSNDRLPVFLFSKHLQFLNYADMAEVTAEHGFEGLDLTVRPTGHVEPERAQDDLPRAAEAMKSNGLKLDMFVSRVTNVDDTVGIQSLKTASALGFKSYRMGYYKPDASGTLRENLSRIRSQMTELAAFNKRYGLHGAYQNHAGQHMGSFVTDLADLLDGLDPRWSGSQYDIRHATVDGGASWPLGLRYLKDHIKTIAIKDFIWAQVGGQWKVINVPLGEGMVDFDRFFKLLRSYGIRPSVSLHLEYDLGGADKGSRTLTIPKRDVYAAMKRDLKRFHELWEASAT